MIRRVIRAAGAAVFAGTLTAASLVAGVAHAADPAPYAGLEDRSVSTLSEADLAALAAGDGWGLALPAELNGLPGPRHVLDAADELGLDAEQRARIEAIFEAMRAEAVARGAAYVAAEASLDAAFRGGGATPEDVARLTAEAGEALAALRTAHLVAHLETTPLLTRHQQRLYAELRGYAESGDAGSSDHGGHGRASH